MKRARVSILIFTIGIVLAIQSQVQAIMLAFETTTSDVLLGDSLSVDLVVSGLGANGPDSLGAFDLDVVYDDTILAFSEYQLGEYLGDISLFEAEGLSAGEYIPGQVNVAELSYLDADPFSGPFFIGPYLDEIQPDNFTIATLTFSTLSQGEVQFNLGNLAIFGDGFGDPLFLENVPSLEINVSPAPVPEPTTLLLFGAGLACLAGVSRRRVR